MSTKLDKLRKEHAANKLLEKKRKIQFKKERAYRKTPGVKLGTTDAMAEAQRLGKEISDATTPIAMDKALRKFKRSFKSHEEMKEKLSDPNTPYPTPSKKTGGKVSRKAGGTIKKQAGGKMSHQGLYPAEEKRSGTLPERKRKKGGTMKRKSGGTIKKQAGGLTQGYDARLDESLAARHRGTKGNLAARRHESEGMERTLGHRPYSGARTMAKKGGSVRRKKGSTVSRKAGGKIMQGYKAGGKV